MRKLSLKWSSFLSIAVIVGVLAVLLAGLGRTTKEEAERQLAAALPPGSTEAQVKGYFARSGIEFTIHNGSYIGRMHNVNRSLIVQENLVLFVDVDQTGRVLRTWVRRDLVGP